LVLSSPHQRDLQQDDLLFNAVMWCTSHERALYEKYPMVLAMDAQAETNIEDRPLLTIASFKQ
jgi:hypothetical protein